MDLPDRGRPHSTEPARRCSAGTHRRRGVGDRWPWPPSVGKVGAWPGRPRARSVDTVVDLRGAPVASRRLPDGVIPEAQTPSSCARSCQPSSHDGRIMRAGRAVQAFPKSRGRFEQDGSCVQGHPCIDLVSEAESGCAGQVDGCRRTAVVVVGSLVILRASMSSPMRPTPPCSNRTRGGRGSLGREWEEAFDLVVHAVAVVAWVSAAEAAPGR